jgi:exopolyphosphatase/guanosine-5'-triphosphate,3'-diphosphate pyrophosphatase
VYGDDSIEWWHSYDIGSVRLTDRCLTERPSPPTQTARARAQCDEIFESMPPFEPATVLGVAGSFTRVAALIRGLAEYDRNAVDGMTLWREDFTLLVDRLSGLTLEETIALRAIDPKRAPVMLGGTIVGERVLLAAGASSVSVCTQGVLDGLVTSMLT